MSSDGQNVTTLIYDRLPYTAWLIFGTVLVSLFVTFVVSLIAAHYRDGLFDHMLRPGLLFALFVPSFWVGFMLIRSIAIPTGLFPVAGLGDTPGDLVRSLVLPSITGAIALSPVLIRSLRSRLIEVLDSEYVAVARSVGIQGFSLRSRHVMRNALGPMVTLLALNVGYLLFGVVILEATFNVPGLGTSLIEASAKQDSYTVQGITLLFALGVVFSNYIGEIIVAALDPRTAHS
jgi:peptide/nickel transport system permease protein